MFKIVKKHPLHTLMTKTIIESSEYLLFYSSRGQSDNQEECINVTRIYCAFINRMMVDVKKRRR